jgi:hypothetical protein
VLGRKEGRVWISREQYIAKSVEIETAKPQIFAELVEPSCVRFATAG